MDNREAFIRQWLGKQVYVEVDRPIGYCHNGIVYPINYGYIPGVMAADGEEQDTYILGVEEPVRSFDGWVVGAVRRLNDCEDKLVVAPEGTVFHQGEIAQAVHFQEQYFQTRVDSIFRKSCGVMPFRWRGEAREFLILLQTSSFWSFPKGHMEAGETEVETALREMREETGLEAILTPNARAVARYHVGDKVQKELVLFLGEVQGEIKLQAQEIQAFRWVPQEALGQYLLADVLEASRQLLIL